MAATGLLIEKMSKRAGHVSYLFVKARKLTNGGVLI